MVFHKVVSVEAKSLKVSGVVDQAFIFFSPLTFILFFPCCGSAKGQVAFDGSLSFFAVIIRLNCFDMRVLLRNFKGRDI